MNSVMMNLTLVEEDQTFLSQLLLDENSPETLNISSSNFNTKMNERILPTPLYNPVEDPTFMNLIPSNSTYSSPIMLDPLSTSLIPDPIDTTTTEYHSSSDENRSNYSPHSDGLISDDSDKQLNWNFSTNKSEIKRTLKAKAAKKYRSRQKEYASDLRKTVQNLQDKLRQLRLTRNERERENGPASDWEKMALSQRMLVSKAQQENSSLRAALEEQMKFNRSLMRLFERNPNNHTQLTKIISESWKQFHLPSDHESRLPAITQIMQMQMDKLNTVLISSDIYDTTEDLRKDTLRTKPSSIEIIRHTNFYQVEAQKIIDSFWDIYVGKLDPKTKCGTKVQLLEALDANTVYVHMKCNKKIPNAYFESFLLVKRFQNIQGNSILIWRSVLHDPKYMIPGRSLWIADEEGWMVVGSKNNEEDAYRKSVCYFYPPFDYGDPTKREILDDRAVHCISTSVTRMELLIYWIAKGSNEGKIAQV